MEDVRRRGHEFADLLWVGDYHDRVLADRAQGEARAVAAARALEERGGTRPVAERLEGRRQLGPGGQVIGHLRLPSLECAQPSYRSESATAQRRRRRTVRRPPAR